jgi:hypothetical protein
MRKQALLRMNISLIPIDSSSYMPAVTHESMLEDAPTEERNHKRHESWKVALGKG